MSMRAALRVDPRRAARFEDFGIKEVVLKALPAQLRAPLPVQKKMLALNGSGLSLLARSLPNTGKSTAAVLGLLSTPRQDRANVTNLVLVPSPALADQYFETMSRMVGGDESFRVLYRNGTAQEAEDEAQHARLVAPAADGGPQAPHTLIATPARVLDYLSSDPALVPLSNLRQLVVDELDVFRHANPARKTTLEVLLEYIFAANGGPGPLMTLMTSDMTTRFLEFAVLPQLLDQQAGRRYIYEVSEMPRTAWDGELRAVSIDGTPVEWPQAEPAEASAAHAKPPTPDAAPSSGPVLDEKHLLRAMQLVRSLWTGKGLVVAPAQASPLRLQEYLGDDVPAPVVRPEEIAGVTLDDVEDMYIIGMRPAAELNKLKWMLRGPRRVVTVVLV